MVEGSAAARSIAPMSAGAVQAESNEILTKTVVIHFFPNSWDLYKKVAQNENGKEQQALYDPNVDFVIEEVAKLAGQYGAARIVVEGHTDSSYKGQIPAQAVKDLSERRANAVKEALVRKYPSLDPRQFSCQGMGWDKPADPKDPMNQALNRRVEIKVFPLEAAP